MPTWNLQCRNCRRTFYHSVVSNAPFTLFSPDKPEFPAGGSLLECPHCCQSFTYQRYELLYGA
jgi:hypothetical protein